MTNLDSIFKSRDITLPTKAHLVKAMVFPVVMYGCESWTVKKAERRRIDAFELWCWRRLSRVPWIARRSNQSILKEINPEYSLEGLMLRLKLQYFGHLMQRADAWSRRWSGLLGGNLCSRMKGKGHCGWWGIRCWWKPSSCVGPSLSLYHQLRGGRKGAGKSLFSCVSVPVFKLIFDDFAYPCWI